MKTLRTLLRRARRPLLLLLGILVGLILLVLIGISIRPVREEALRRALVQGSAALPGDLQVFESRWPSLQLVEFDQLSWTLDGDTLFTASYLRIEPDFRALLSRDLHLRRLSLDEIRADLPSITQAFATEDAGNEASTDESGKTEADGNLFPRAGRIPALPSIGVDRLDLSFAEVSLEQGESLRGRLGLSAEARADQPVHLSAEIEVRLGERPPITLEAGPTGEGSWQLVVRGASEEPVLNLGLSGYQALGVGHDGARLSLQLRVPDAPSATAFPLLDSLLLASPELIGGEVLLVGSIGHEQRDPFADLELILQHWPVLELARGTLRWEKGLGEFELGLEKCGGVEGRIHLQGPQPAYEAQAEFQLTDGAQLQPLLPPNTLPSDLTAGLKTSASYAPAGELLEFAGRLTGASPSRGLDELQFEIEGAGELGALVGELSLFARSDRISLSARSQLELGETLRLALSPLLVRVDSSLHAVPESLRVDPNSRVVVDETTRTVAVEALRIEGDAGRAQINLGWSSHVPRSLDLNWEWHHPPAILSLLAESSAREDSIRELLWQADGSYLVSLQARETAIGSEDFEIQLDAKLPAPWRILPGMPNEHRSRGEPLLVHAEADGSLDSAQVALSAQPNDWLKNLRLDLRRADTLTLLDSLRLELEGVLLRVEGELRDDQLEAQLQLAFHNDPFLREWLGEGFTHASSRLTAQAEISGPLDALDAELLAGAEFRSLDANLDTLSVMAQMEGGRLSSATLHATGIRYERWQLERLGAQWQAEGATLFPSLVALNARGRDFEFVQIARVHRDSIWTVEVDSVGLLLSKQDLRSQHPFRVLVDPEEGAFWLDGLRLAGTLGKGTSDLRFGPRVKQGQVDLHLVLPDAPVSLGVPEGAWPRTLDLELEVDSLRLAATLEASGIGLGKRRDLALNLSGSSGPDSIRIDISLADEERHLAQGRALIPLGYVADGPRWDPRPGRSELNLEIADLPLPARIGGRQALEDYFLGRGQKHAPLLNAYLDLVQVDGHPRGEFQARVSFEDIPELSRDALELGVVWMAPDDPPVTGLGDSELNQLMEQARADLEGRGIGVRLEWETDEQPTLWMSAYSPLLWNPDQGRIDWENRPLRADLKTAQIRLEDFNRFLPDRFRVRGLLEGRASVEGTLPELQIDGTLQGRQLVVAQPGRAEATANLDFQFSGSTSAPKVRGKVVLEQGTVRLPESRKSFHDAEGRSLLWEADLEAAAQDSTYQTVFGPIARTAANDTLGPPTLLPVGTDMSVELSIPRNLWIRGRGLDVRLNGDLKMTQKEGKPVVVGQLETTEGSLNFMSKTFRARRGQVEFFGDPTNPSLDLELNTRVSDVDIIILIRGTARRPELEMRSDPYMEEADIMSYLLFGGPTASLDQAGSDLLSQQAINALEGFAIPALEGGVGSELGISMIQLTRNEEAGKGMNIMVGRYITPEILLRYEMSLEDSQDYAVNLEYWINRRLSLQSYYSQARESGVSVNWTKDY